MKLHLLEGPHFIQASLSVARRCRGVSFYLEENTIPWLENSSLFHKGFTLQNPGRSTFNGWRLRVRIDSNRESPQLDRGCSEQTQTGPKLFSGQGFLL